MASDQARVVVIGGGITRCSAPYHLALAGDGHLDPHGATHAVADAARALGVRIRQGVRVTGFELTARREIRRVVTDAGAIDAELVVNAAGIWAPQVAAMVGAFIPSTPV